MRSKGHPSLYYKFIAFLRQQKCKFETGGSVGSFVYIVSDNYDTYVFHFDNEDYVRISRVSYNGKDKFQLFVPARTVQNILDKLLKFDSIFKLSPCMYKLAADNTAQQHVTVTKS